eukprot:jgi/Tetstr1/430069/TSEL_019927.t1
MAARVSWAAVRVLLPLLLLLAGGGAGRAWPRQLLAHAAAAAGELEYELYPRLPALQEGGAGGRVKVSVVSVCIVASEFAGIVPNGGIGTFYSTLAETLAGAGHQVTLLYTQGARSQHAHLGYEHWVDYYAGKGIRLVPLTFWRPQSTGYHSGTAFMVYDWLRQNRFDVVHFPDWQGHGYYALLAKHLGLDFKHTTMCLMIHGPLYWARTSNAQGIDTVEDVETDFLERESIHAAEVLISPSHYLINWVTNQTWRVPDTPGAIRTQPYILPHEAKRVLAKVNAESGAAPRGLWQRSQVNELCFFGRLEVRKGIVLFLDAIDSLLTLNRTSPAEAGLPPAFTISFLGSDRNTIMGSPSRAYIERRARAWGPAIAVNIFTDKDSAMALTYMKGPGRMAVLPSLVENSPLAILELMGASVPFIASTAGGIPELIHEDFRPKMLFKPQLADIRQRLAEMFLQGALVPAPHYDMGQVERSWVDFHVGEASKHAAGRAMELEDGESASEAHGCWEDDGTQACRMPLGNSSAAVTVVVVDRQGGAPLQATMRSVLNQEKVFEEWGGPRVEQLVLMPTTAAPATLDGALGGQLAARFVGAGGQLARGPQGATLAEARNAALELARGDLVLFVDGGCVLETFAMRTLLKVYQQTGAAAVSSFVKFYKGDITATTSAAALSATPGVEQWFQVFLGASASMGLFRNVFGGPVMLFSAEVLRQLGGYEAQPTGYDHWNLLARMNLAELHHEVVPQMLTWAAPASMNGIAVRDYKDNAYWKAAAKPYGAAKLGGFHGVHWRTQQSVLAAMNVLSPLLQVDLTTDEGVKQWLDAA